MLDNTRPIARREGWRVGMELCAGLLLPERSRAQDFPVSLSERLTITRSMGSRGQTHLSGAHDQVIRMLTRLATFHVVRSECNRREMHSFEYTTAISSVPEPKVNHYGVGHTQHARVPHVIVCIFNILVDTSLMPSTPEKRGDGSIGTCNRCFSVDSMDVIASKVVRRRQFNVKSRTLVGHLYEKNGKTIQPRRLPAGLVGTGCGATVLL